MIHRRTTLCVLLVVCLLAAAPAPQKKPDAAKPKTDAAKPKATWLTRAQKALLDGEVLDTGPRVEIPKSKRAADRRKEILGFYRAVDEGIKAYLKEHPDTDPAVVKSMWEGKPVIGMTQDELALFGNVGTEGETTNTRQLQLTVVHPGIGVCQWRVTVSRSDGKVTSWGDLRIRQSASSQNGT